MARRGSAAQLSTSYHRTRTASGLPSGLIESVTLKLAAESKATQLSPAVKKKALVACLIALTIGNMMIENMASFLPPFVGSHTWKSDDNYALTPFDISLILSIFSIAQVIFAPFNSIIKNKLGAKNAVLVGFTLLTLATFGLGAIANFTDPHTFKYFAVALRFIQGQGDIMLQITCYTLITQMYVEDIMNMIRYIEICVGLGLGMGPFLGSLVYGSLQY
jgi:MFS family permease